MDIKAEPKIMTRDEFIGKQTPKYWELDKKLRELSERRDRLVRDVESIDLEVEDVNRQRLAEMK